MANAAAAVAVKPVKIKINSTCETTPKLPTLSKSKSGKRSNQVIWVATGKHSYVLEFPGGLFVGRPKKFTLSVPAPPGQSQPLTLDADVPEGKKQYTITGLGCPGSVRAPTAKEIYVNP